MKFVGPLLVVEDIALSKDFYSILLGQQLKYDFGENVTFTGGLSIHAKSHFSGLINVKPREIMSRPKNCELYFEEDDLEGLVARLKQVESLEYLHGIVEQPWGQRVIRFYDPDQHIIEVGESMESVVRRFLARGLSVEATASRTSMPIEFISKYAEADIQGTNSGPAASIFELREWRLEDARSVAGYANNLKIAQNVRTSFPYPYSLPDAIQYINSCINGDKTRQILRAIVINGEAAGSIGMTLQDDIHCRSAEIGYWLGEPFWGQGIITSAIKQICQIAFNQYDILRIFGEAFADNFASRKALEKAGFQLEGTLYKSIWKNGQVKDSCLYAITR